MKENKIAFALGGLAGNNAHGAGFLQAALKFPHFRPLMISCTSGQIRWVAHYLNCLNYQNGTEDLRSILEDQIQKMEPFKCWRDFNFAKLWWSGCEEVYAPAFSDYVRDWWENARTSWYHLVQDPFKAPWKIFLTRRVWEVWPCHLLNPVTDQKQIEDITKSLTDVADGLGIGIVFNSYDPADGNERVYRNKTAYRLLNDGDRTGRHYAPNQLSSYRRPEKHDRKHPNHNATQYDDISTASVRAALHLYAYGFDKERGRLAGQVDGAYFRDIILSELTPAREIFVVRPLPRHWQGRLPRTEVEMQDLQTEVMFQSGYTGERYQIRLVNKLLRGKKIKGNKYKPVKLHEIEMEERRGFFDYCFEDIGVFRESYKRGLNELSKVLHRQPADHAKAA